MMHLAYMQIKTMTLLFDQLFELQEHFGRNIYQWKWMIEMK